jgi:hypothetical protein
MLINIERFDSKKAIALIELEMNLKERNAIADIMHNPEFCEPLRTTIQNTPTQRSRLKRYSTAR